LTGFGVAEMLTGQEPEPDIRRASGEGFMTVGRYRRALASALALGFFANAGAAQETTLSALNFLPNNQSFGFPLVELVDAVNRDGRGLVKIDIKPFGAIPVFEMGNAIKSGVADMANLPATFYQNLLPVGEAIKMMTKPPEEFRKNGGFEFYNKLHNEKVNVEVLGTYGYGAEFHLYLRDKPIQKADVTGFKLRVTPIYRAFFRALGAQIVVLPPPEVQAALERGIVDGYGWPLWDIKGPGWERYTKYRVEPGFYQVIGGFIMNLDKWKALRPDQRQYLARKATEYESNFKQSAAAKNAHYAKEQADAGVQVIKLSGAEAEKYLEIAYEAGWEEHLKADPENAAKLRAFIAN
jgi:TRAP-type C4-dicarboxylate transport system substrate-binding protein